MRFTTVCSIVSCVLATGGIMAASAQEKAPDSSQSAATAAPAEMKAPEAKPMETKAPESKPAEDKPEGKIIGKIFADWNYDATHNPPAANVNYLQKSLFELTRVYLGYDYKLNKALSTEALLDVQRIDPYVASSNTATNPGTTVKVDTGKTTNLNTISVEGPLALKLNDSYIAYIKTAFLSWKNLIPTTTLTVGQFTYFAFDVMEGFWGHRYIYKSFMDQEGYASSADLGAKLLINPIDMLKITVGITQGEGYKANQDAYGDYKLAGGLQVNPIKDLTLYLYGDWMPEKKNFKDSAQQTVAAFAGYNILNMAKVGLEYDNQFRAGGVVGHNLHGASAYAMYNIIKELEVFARYDYAWSENKYSTNDGQTAIGGLQYCPLKQVKLALDYQRVTPRITGGSIGYNKVFLNGEFDY